MDAKPLWKNVRLVAGKSMWIKMIPVVVNPIIARPCSFINCSKALDVMPYYNDT